MMTPQQRAEVEAAWDTHRLLMAFDDLERSLSADGLNDELAMLRGLRVLAELTLARFIDLDLVAR